MQQKKILLVEPKARTSYPPLGLMKIATYHGLKGDVVDFTIGNDRSKEPLQWDTIYITSTFTYDFKSLVETVKYYRGNFANIDNVRVGGIAATLLSDRVEYETGVAVHQGLLDEVDPFLLEIADANPQFAYLKECGASIDNLPPSYALFSSTQKYSKITDDAYYFFATKGCPNKCEFCAVRTLEPRYLDYIPIEPRIRYIADNWGERSGLLLLDNNIAASGQYDRIIDEIKDCGFGAGSKLKLERNGRVIYKQRYVDFNQGVDLRLLDKRKMQKMATIAVKPLRLAFDNLSLAAMYEKKMRLAIDCGVTNLSNYMLYNFKDYPVGLYRRFMINLSILKDNPGVKIFSFPMRYSPIEMIDRTYVGQHWTKREIRALQLVLNATHGIVSHKENFFYHAFGFDEEHFLRILLYPYSYIINRVYYENVDKRIQQWESDYSSLSVLERQTLKSIIASGPIQKMQPMRSRGLNRILAHYENEHAKVLGS